MAQVYKSSLEKGIWPFKLRVSFSDASSWKHWKAPGSKLCGYAKISIHGAPGLGVEQLYFLGEHRVVSSYLRQNQARGKESYNRSKMSQDTQAPAPRVGLKASAKRSKGWLGHP